MHEKPPKSKPGPEEQRLKVDDDWEKAVKKALNTPRPTEGWPEPEDPGPENRGRKR